MSDERDWKAEIIGEFFSNYMPVPAGADPFFDPDIILMSSDEIVTSLCKTVTVTVDEVTAAAKERNFRLKLCPDGIMRWTMYSL